MSALDTKSLLGKLNKISRRCLDDALRLCLTRTNYNVELEHWLYTLVEAPDTDFVNLFRTWDINPSRVLKELTVAIDKLKTGNAKSPGLSPDIPELVREGWLLASIEYHAVAVRSSHLLLALVSDESLWPMIIQTSPELRKISAEGFRKNIGQLIANSPENDSSYNVNVSQPGSDRFGSAGAAPYHPEIGSAGGQSRTPALDQFTSNLTERARHGGFDKIRGRDAEIRQVIDILTRRRQNNPILTGEAGVGKTAVVEGFAQRIVAGDVPPSLQNVALHSLDLGLLQAGAGVRGEFENRLKSVLDEVKKSPTPIILFIDEAHTLIGAGGEAGQGDAANMLKPALARGELRTIAATTWAEYKKYFEEDAALARRFQVIKVEEPTEVVAVDMMRGLVDSLESHHRVRILDEAVSEAVRLSSRYLTGRQLPDKCVSLLDTACARVAISHSAIPAAIEDCRRTIENVEMTMKALQRECAAGANHEERLLDLNLKKSESEVRLKSFHDRWQIELELAKEIRDLREKLIETVQPCASPGPAGLSSDNASVAADQDQSDIASANLSMEAKAELKKNLGQLESRLSEIQGECPLVKVHVDGQTIADVVSSWTGIPIGRMVRDEITTVLNLRHKLEERIIGQSHALETISKAIRTSRANLTDPRKPIGVFLLVGTSGVGKTETALALADLLYGGDQNMTVFNMSEFKEESKVSMLTGTSAGYVGYGKGGVLTEAVRRKPYTVVLLDEMEKAHSGLQDVFYQVFDKGTLRDGEGRDTDFKNTLILMTSNAGTDLILKLCSDPDTCPEPGALAEILHTELLKTFKPAFLGRVSIVPYFPLSDEIMRQIIELQLRRVAKRIRENYQAELSYVPELISQIADRCKEVHTGARSIEHILTGTILPALSSEFLTRMAESQPIARVHIAVEEDGRLKYDVS